MKEKKRNPFVLLICVIVLLVFAVIVLALTNIPLITSARENAFRIEANNVVAAGRKIYSSYLKGEYDIGDKEEKACIMENRKICVSLDKLLEDDYYKNKNYRGKIEIDITDSNNPIYILYLAKGAEFRIVNLTYTNYTEYGQVNNGLWDTSYESCECNQDY